LKKILIDSQRVVRNHDSGYNNTSSFIQNLETNLHEDPGRLCEPPLADGHFSSLGGIAVDSAGPGFGGFAVDSIQEMERKLNKNNFINSDYCLGVRKNEEGPFLAGGGGQDTQMLDQLINKEQTQ